MQRKHVATVAFGLVGAAFLVAIPSLFGLTLQMKGTVSILAVVGFAGGAVHSLWRQTFGTRRLRNWQEHLSGFLLIFVTIVGLGQINRDLGICSPVPLVLSFLVLGLGITLFELGQLSGFAGRSAQDKARDE
jgi:hypothetical protein